MSELQPKSRPLTMEDILERRKGSRWVIFASWELGNMPDNVWLTACCPMAAVDCPAVPDEDDELVCPRCRGTR